MIGTAKSWYQICFFYLGRVEWERVPWLAHFFQGIHEKTVKKYFEILANTFLGFYLESYHRLDLKFSYLKTKTDLEIDLIVERPKQYMFKE